MSVRIMRSTPIITDDMRSLDLACLIESRLGVDIEKIIRKKPQRYSVNGGFKILRSTKLIRRSTMRCVEERS